MEAAEPPDLAEAQDPADTDEPSGAPSAISEAQEDPEAAYQAQIATGRLPVLDAEGGRAGWMDADEYYAGTQDPLIIEVRSHETDDLVGYRIRHVGFVPTELVQGEGTLEDIVYELFGETQAEGALRQEEFRAFVDSFEPGELTRAIDDYEAG